MRLTATLLAAALLAAAVVADETYSQEDEWLEQSGLKSEASEAADAAQLDLIEKGRDAEDLDEDFENDEYEMDDVDLEGDGWLATAGDYVDSAQDYDQEQSGYGSRRRTMSSSSKALAVSCMIQAKLKYMHQVKAKLAAAKGASAGKRRLLGRGGTAEKALKTKQKADGAKKNAALAGLMKCCMAAMTCRSAFKDAAAGTTKTKPGRRLLGMGTRRRGSASEVKIKTAEKAAKASMMKQEKSAKAHAKAAVSGGAASGAASGVDAAKIRAALKGRSITTAIARIEAAEKAGGDGAKNLAAIKAKLVKMKADIEQCVSAQNPQCKAGATWISQ